MFFESACRMVSGAGCRVGRTRLAQSLVALCLLWAAPGVAGAPLDAHIALSGHSLTDPIADPLSVLVRATGGRAGKIDLSTIPGSPMDYRWDHAPHPPQPDLRDPAVMEDYDVLVITERASLSGTMPWHNSPKWALHWAEHAWSSGARTVIYATWVEVTSGPDFANPYDDPEGHLPFADRLPLEMARWQQILDHVNAHRPADMPAVTLIPGPLIMAAAAEAISEGAAPGITQIEALFSDDIHLSPMGAYLMALGHYAVVYGRDPRGLPQGVPARGGPDKAQAAWMQDLVWRVTTSYSGAGLGG